MTCDSIWINSNHGWRGLGVGVGVGGYPQNAGVLVVLVVIVFHGTVAQWNGCWSLCFLKQVNQHPDLEKIGSVKSTITIYCRTHGHNCDTKNKPVIDRMEAFSSTDSDAFWREWTLQFFLATAGKIFGYHGSLPWNIDPIQIRSTVVIDTFSMRHYSYKWFIPGWWKHFPCYVLIRWIWKDARVSSDWRDFG